MGGRIYVDAGTDVGKVRANNEDSFFCGHYFSEKSTLKQFKSFKLDVEPYFCAVFDGMGGEEHGEDASHIAASELNEKVKNLKCDTRFSVSGFFSDFFESANKKIIKKADELKCEFIGTTCVLACMMGNKIFVGNIGDSRAYFLTNGKISRISKDHTLARKLVDAGKMSEAEAEHCAEKHKLLKCLGIHGNENSVSPFYAKPIVATQGDVLILCSDGLTDMLDDNEMEKIVLSHKSSKEICAELITRANEKGGVDNTTAIVVKFN